MKGFVLEREIDAAPEQVFALASDFPRAAERVRGIVKIEMLTPGPVGVGTRFRETRAIFGREAAEEMEVVAFDPPRGYTLACESHGCRYRTELRCEPRGGGTNVVTSFEATPVTFTAKALSFLLSGMVRGCRKELAKDLEDLRVAAEGRAAAAPARP